MRREFSNFSLRQSRLIMMWRVLGLVELDRIYPLDVLAVVLVQEKYRGYFRNYSKTRN